MFVYRYESEKKNKNHHVSENQYQNEGDPHYDAWKDLLKKVHIPCSIWIGFGRLPNYFKLPSRNISSKKAYLRLLKHQQY